MKNVFFLSTLIFTSIFFSQEKRVGINTDMPATTLDINGKKIVSHPDGLQAPRLTREELTNKDESVYGEAQKGALIYITDVSGGDTNNQREKVTTIGYYYFDGVKWEKLFDSSDELKNIYIADGTLIGNRKVTEEGYTLTFEGNVKGANKFINTEGTVDNQVSPIKIIDGGQAEGKVLTSDNEGNATWKKMNNAQKVNGKYGTGELKYYNKAIYTGASITLPPGKWAVFLGQTLQMKYTPLVTEKGYFWLTYFFADKDIDINLNDYTLDGKSNGTSYLLKVLLPTSTPRQFISGVQILENSTKSDKTYYLHFFSNENFSQIKYGIKSTVNDKDNHIKNSFRGWERYFYAIRVVD